jgi:hypothetical protein
MKKHSLLGILLAAAVVIVLLTGNAAAQTTAAISGTATDASGAVIVGAQVTIHNNETDLVRTVQTNEAGRYFAPALPPGQYSVTAAATGFEKVTHPDIVLTVGRELVLDFSMRLGGVTEKVEVTSQPSQVETTTSSLSGLVDSQRIRALPLNGRSFDQLIFLQPGVNVATAAGSSPNQGRGVKFSVAGGRLTSNYFLLDGTDINDSQNFTPGGAGGQLPGIEAIREFQVITHNAAAEYGHSTGGIITAVGKSGTNSLHGDVYEFLRNSVFDAKNFFDDHSKPTPLFIRNQYGAAVGGPIKKDKLFFFGNYEGLRERLNYTASGVVPDLNARSGKIVDPVSGKVTTVQVNPSVIPYLNLIPAPTGGAVGPGLASFVATREQPAHVDYGTGKIDWNPTSKDSIFAHYTIDQSTKLRQDASDTVLGLFAEDEYHRNQYVSLSATRVISERTLNTARFGFNRSTTLVNLFNQGNVPSSLSFIPGQVFGHISVSSFNAPSAVVNDPRFFRMNSFQPGDDLTMTRGKHVLKTGVIFERFQWNTAAFNRIGGDYSFDSLQNFLLGAAKSVIVPFPGSEPSRGIRALLFGTYAQDDWHVTRRLTLNMGLRYELTTVPTEVNGKMSFLTSPSATALKFTQPYKGNHLNFAPRFGFAWDPFGDGKTSVRGGYGIYYDQELLNTFLNLFDRNPNPDLKTGWLTVTLSCPKTPCAQSVVPFPNPLTVAQNASPGFTLQNIDYNNFKTPYSEQYSLSVQRQFPASIVASASYVGSRGKHVLERYDGNTPVPITLPGGVPCNPGAVSATNPILPAGTLCTPSNATRRNTTPGIADLQTRSTTGLAYYDSLQVSVGGVAKNLHVQGVYTWAKSIDMSGGLFSEEADNAATGLSQPDNVFADKGLSNFDIRHNVVMNFIYDLPFAKGSSGATRYALRGWQLGSISRLASGEPFTVENSFNRSQNKLSGANFADRPNLVPGASPNPTSGVSAGCTLGNVTIAAGTPVGTPQHWFDPCAFQPQPLGTFGNLRRNSEIGPGLLSWDFMLGKNTPIGEGKELQFRAEFFNILNHPNFEAPTKIFRQIFDSAGNVSPTFGQLNAPTTTTSRQIQFGLKFLF